MQKLYCPICHKILIKNSDLVIDDIVVFDFDKIKQTNKSVNTITCHNCKRKIKYYVESAIDKC